MRVFVVVMAAMALLVATVSCEKTVYEPGEPEHGGIFLHGTPGATTTP